MNKLTRIAAKAGILTRNSADASPVVDGVSVLPRRATAYEHFTAHPAVYRAIQILATQARQLTIDIWRGGELIPAEQHEQWIRRPSMQFNSFGAFTAATVTALAVHGNAFWYINRDPKGLINNLALLDNSRVGAFINNGYPSYTLDGNPINKQEIMHLRLTHDIKEPLGKSPLQACATTLQGIWDTEKQAMNWTRTGGAPAGVLTTDQELSPDQAKQWKEIANKTLQYENGIAVLGKNLTYSRTILTPAELQFNESRASDVATIARMFGIPAKMLLASLDGGSDTYSNAEQENQQFIRQTLMGYLAEIEDAFTYLTVRGQYVRFNVDGLLRSDTNSRYSAHEIGLRAGFLTINEARAIEGLPPLPNQPTPSMESIE